MFGGYSSRSGRLRFDRGIGAIFLLIPAVVLAMITYWFWPDEPGNDVAAFGTDTTQGVANSTQSTSSVISDAEPIDPPSSTDDGSNSSLVEVIPPADQEAKPADATTGSMGATGAAISATTTATTPDETNQTTANDPSTQTTAPKQTTAAAAIEPSAPTEAPSTSRAPTTTTAPTTTVAPPTTAATTTSEQATTKPPATDSPTGNCSSNAKFERVFRDDFNGDGLGAQWNTYHSPGNAGFGLRRASAISVENGHLVMTAQMINGNLESGGMSHQLAQTYGMYKVRVRTDDDPSKATSGVIITWPASNVHPRDGENNIYETGKTHLRNPFYSYIHEPFGTIHDQKQFVHNADGAQFQVMTMEWTPNRITVTREGPGGGQSREVHVLDENGDDLIPDVPHRMTVQLDAWSNTMTGVVRMEVDWLEIYKYCGG